MTAQRVLVLGASGYIGQNLIPHLIEQGHHITAAARRIEWLQEQHWPQVNCQYVDVYRPETLAAALWEIDAVYYLIHGMGDGDDFIEKERQAAENLRDALRNSSVKQVIFLGALQPEGDSSPHLVARKLTGEILRQSGVPVTELRASIIVGPGSAAFEIMRDMVYNLPVLTPPRWVRSKSSPVALENLLVYLADLLAHPAEESRIFDVAGPEYISYQTMFERFIAISGKKRWLIPQTLQTFDQAVTATLQREEEVVDSADWGYDPEARARWRPGYGFYPKQAGCSVETQASSQALWHTVQQLGGKEGYFYANILWQIRARMDDMIGNRVVYGRPQRDTLEIGDVVDGWKVITLKPQRLLALLFGMKAPGLGRLAFTIKDHGDHRTLDVRAWWHPAGFSGLLYWFAMMPAHLFIFRGMARRIARLAEEHQRNHP
ncbi:SDR family oxidoreductase [Serratia quinivorans]|uniref:SDR family oxidoreductase n=1 Tax=Serratia quinivorans TaxID=137545 RepID=UPI00217A4E17|nr:SDR family oxidoreductase [Serratia quinivorans]CAI1517585.1 short chain dehydrogenase [Serratia quinivorans]